MDLYSNSQNSFKEWLRCLNLEINAANLNLVKVKQIRSKRLRSFDDYQQKTKLVHFSTHFN